MRAWILGLAAAALAIDPISAAASDYGKFGFGAADIEQFKQMAQSIPACAAALALDQHFDIHAVTIPSARLSIHFSGLCRKALERQRAPRRVLKVNDMYLGMNCMVVGASGDDIDAYPACNTQPY